MRGINWLWKVALVLALATGLACGPKQSPRTTPGSASTDAESTRAAPAAAPGTESTDESTGPVANGTDAHAAAGLDASAAGEAGDAASTPELPAPGAEDVALTTDAQGADPAAVVESYLEQQRTVEALEEATRREFMELFGPDPLGLASHPENLKYELPLDMNDKVDRWITYFEDDIHERFSTYLSRLGRYGPMIQQRLRAAGLPTDLVYLAMIESGLNPRAYSRARAVGIWQFIRGTGRLYGLKVDYWVDERRDPFKSTDAAIAHLSDLYDEFGSWYLAAAAYNAGSGRVRRAIARTGRRDYWDLTRGTALRRETRSYVPKMIAAAIIAKNPEKYGFRGIVPEPPLEFDVAEVPDATSMDVLAEAAETDEEVMRGLNPEYLRHVTPPDRRVTIRVPPGKADAFRVNYASIPADKRVTWLIHVVTRGQTLGQIARRYGTSVAALRAANGNVNPRRIQIGQKLVVPRSGTPTRLASSSGQSATRSAPGPATVTVRRGDTLWSLARRHGVSTTDLMRWNNLSSSKIHPGDRLTVRR
ncbi:MAG: LysM peptidoglycan-binding domain-containing protein [Gemmatimonadales bacterium]